MNNRQHADFAERVEGIKARVERTRGLPGSPDQAERLRQLVKLAQLAANGGDERHPASMDAKRAAVYAAEVGQ